MANYIALVHKEPNSEYGVSFPDFPGCVTAGSTVDEAKDLAQEALALHVAGMLADNEAIPTPSRLEDILANPENVGVVAILVVGAPESLPKSVRVNITIPENTLRQIDVAARKQGLSRSSFLVRAARLVLEEARE